MLLTYWSVDEDVLQSVFRYIGWT